MIDQAAPYPLILSAYLFSIFICLFGFVRSNVLSESRLGWIRSAMLWSVICLVLQIVLLDLPHHWSSLSLAGKLVAQFVGNAVIFTASGLTIAVANKRELHRLRLTISAYVIGVLAIAPSLIAALYLACLLTRDCL